MDYTNYPGGITSMGIPTMGATGIPITSGTYFFVNSDTGSDGNDGLSMNSPLKTYAAAYAKVITNKYDVICLTGNASHSISAMIDFSKNRVITVGLDGGYRAYGQRTKLSMGVTVATTDVFAIKNTGVGNVFINLKIISSNTLTQNIGTFGEGGEYTQFINCEIYNSAKLTSDTHAEMVLNGDSTQFSNCTIGSLADAVTGDKIRPAILLTAGTVATGKVCRDVYFDKCRFWKNAGGTTTAFIKGAATDIERVMEFHDCQFIANPLGSTPAVAIDVANLTVGMILLTGDTCATNCTKIGTATGIFNCTPARVATATIGIQAT